VKRSFLVGIAALSLLTACGGASTGLSGASAQTSSGSPSPSSTGSSNSVPPFPKAAAQQAAASALLTVSDFPAGWSTSPSSNSAGSAKYDQQFAACLHAPVSVFQKSGPDTAEADSPDFNSPEDTNASASETISIETTASIDEGFRVLKSPNLPGCATTALTAYFKVSLAKQAATEHATIGQATTGQLSFPSIGEDTVAISVTVPVTVKGFTITEYVDLIYVRRRNAEIEMEFSNTESPFDVRSAETITRKAYKQLLSVHIPKA
jgi:hypothetical protein